MAVFEVNNQTLGKKAVAVRFSNGTLNSNCQERVKFKCYTKKDPALKIGSKHIVTAEVDGMTYVGKTFGPSNRFQTENCDYYLGVHNKSTGKIQVISAGLCQLEPVFKDTQAIDDIDNSKSSYREKQDALAKDFGSGRSQRAVNKRINNKMEDDMVSHTTKVVVESKHTRAQAAEPSEEVKTENSAVPPHDKNATTPDEVYKLKDIISTEMIDSLTARSGIFIKCTSEDIATWRTEKKYFSFILGKLETLSLREDARKLQSQCLMYLQLMMQVFLMNSRELGKKFPLPADWPAPVRKQILDTFTLEVLGKSYKRCVPGRLKDLLLSHILVLALKLSQFHLPLTQIMCDLNLSHKRLTTHATILGCTIKKAKISDGQNEFRAVLTVPLKFPEIKPKRSKKKIY